MKYFFLIIALFIVLSYNNVLSFSPEEKLITHFINNSFLGQLPFETRFSIVDLEHHRIVNGTLQYRNIQMFDITIDGKLIVKRRIDKIYFEFIASQSVFLIDIDLLCSSKDLAFLKHIRTSKDLRSLLFSLSGSYITAQQKEKQYIHIKLRDKKDYITDIWFAQSSMMIERIREYDNKKQLLRKTQLSFSYISWDIREYMIHYKKVVTIDEKSFEFLKSSLSLFMNSLNMSSQ